MKKHSLSIFLLAGILSLQASSQDVIRQVACNNDFIMHQADSLKQELSNQGFIVLKEASMTMESGYEMPIVVPLTKGSWYQFVFIGEYSSKLYEVRMYDIDENMVANEKKHWGDVDGNIISYSYIPHASVYHMIKPVQVNKKKKGLCGYVMLLKQVR